MLFRSPGVTVPTLMTAAHTQEAWARHLEHLDRISERQIREDEGKAAIWARTGERTSKLALIFAASRCWKMREVVIELEDVERAIALSNWVARTILEKVFLFVGENETETSVKKVYRMIKESPAGSISRTALTRRTQWLKKRDRNELLEGLLEAGLITQEPDLPKSGTGPATATWVATLT